MEVGVRPLTKTSITPNQLTSLRLLTGMSSSVFYAIGLDIWTYLASGLLIFSIILDRADGILARLTDSSTEKGHKFDLISDSVCNASCFIGIGIGLRESYLAEWAIVMGIVAGISITIILIVVAQIETQLGIRAAELGGLGGFDPDDAMLIVPLAMIAGLGPQIVIGGAIGGFLFALLFLWKFRKELRR